MTEKTNKVFMAMVDYVGGNCKDDTTYSHTYDWKPCSSKRGAIDWLLEYAEERPWFFNMDLVRAKLHRILESDKPFVDEDCEFYHDGCPGTFWITGESNAETRTKGTATSHTYSDEVVYASGHWAMVVSEEEVW